MCNNLELKPLGGGSGPSLKDMVSGHRRQAEMIALGKSRETIARELGTTPARIQKLTQTPAFENLVANFRK